MPASLACARAVIVGDLMSVPAGTLFAAAPVAGLRLSIACRVYIAILCTVRPQLAPPLPKQASVNARDRHF